MNYSLSFNSILEWIQDQSVCMVISLLSDDCQLSKLSPYLFFTIIKWEFWKMWDSKFCEKVGLALSITSVRTLEWLHRLSELLPFFYINNPINNHSKHERHSKVQIIITLLIHFKILFLYLIIELRYIQIMRQDGGILSNLNFLVILHFAFHCTFLLETSSDFTSDNVWADFILTFAGSKIVVKFWSKG